MPVWKFRSGGGSGQWAYQGEVSTSTSPESSMKFALSHVSEVPLAFIPEHGLKVGRVYPGEVQVALTPEHAEKIGRVYAGEVPLSLSPEHAEKLVRAYAGEVPLALTLEHIEKMLWAYLGEVQASWLPEGEYLLVERGTWSYAGEIPLGFSQEHGLIATRVFPGDVALSLGVEHSEKILRGNSGETQVALSLEGSTLVELIPYVIRTYSGEVQNGLSPEAGIKRIATHRGELVLESGPEGFYSFSLTGDGMVGFGLRPEALRSLIPITIYRSPHGELILCSLSGRLALCRPNGGLVNMAEGR